MSDQTGPSTSPASTAPDAGPAAPTPGPASPSYVHPAGDDRSAPLLLGATPRLNAALALLQGALPRIDKGETAVVEKKAGDTFTYTYADLADISAAIMSKLSEHGLAFTAFPTMQGNTFVLAYSLLHVSGEERSGVYPLGAFGNAQAVGSAITYGRRYCLCAVTGVAPADQDDDGAAATRQATRPAEPPPLPPDVAEARAKVLEEWQRVHGPTARLDPEHYAGNVADAGAPGLWQAGARELRRYASYLATLPDKGTQTEGGADPTAAAADEPTGAPAASPSPANAKAKSRPQNPNYPGTISGPMVGKLHELLTPIYGTDKPARVQFLTQWTGRPIGSNRDLSWDEARALIDELAKAATSAPPPDDTHSEA